MNRIMLTGAAGLIGSATIRELNKRGYVDVIAVDRLGSCPYKWRNLVGVQIADFWNVEELRRKLDVGHESLSGIDTVIALGARSHTTEQDVAFLMQNNYQFTRTLARWACANGIRFVYASSAATYGADMNMSDSDELDYLLSLRPLNPYGYSKHLADLYLAREGLLGKAAGLKYFNVFGPREYHKGEMRSLVCKAYENLRAGKPIKLFESPRADIKTEEIARDFLSVEDAAKVTVWMALDPKGREAHGLFNVGSGVATSFSDLARFTARAYDLTHGYAQITDLKVWKSWAYEFTGNIKSKRVPMDFPYIRYIPMPEHLRGKYQYYSCADISKLRAAGYTAEFMSAEDAVRSYVKWMAKEDSQ